MRLFNSKSTPIKSLKDTYRESALRWGLRLGISVSVPLLWGLITGNRMAAEWMSIAAEAVAIFELKGKAGQRFRLLFMAFLISVLFAFIGSIMGNIPWLFLLGMAVVGFLAVQFKNLGEHGEGLALAFILFYIIAGAYPLNDFAAINHRIFWVCIGAFWTVLVGLVSFIFIRTGTPYRRSISAIWEGVADLSAAAGKGWGRKETRLSERELYLQEKKVKDAMEASFYLFEEMSEVPEPGDSDFVLDQIRKSAGIVANYVLQIHESAADIARSKTATTRHLSIQIYSVFQSLKQVGERMSEFMFNNKQEERSIVISRLERLEKTVTVLKTSAEREDDETQQLIEKICLNIKRVSKLVHHSLKLSGVLAQEKRVFQTYSFSRTVNVLHPKYLQNDIRQLFNFKMLSTKYALRLGLSLLLAGLVSQFFFSNHGYWIPYTAAMVATPYFGATLKKGTQRSLGTIAGVLIGTLFLQLPFPIITKVLLVFISSIYLIYFLKINYAVAAFFITLSLVGVLSLEPVAPETLRVTLLLRVSGTVLGSIIAILSGFVLLPTRDRKLFPKYRYEAFRANRLYFINTFYSNYERFWTTHKREAETLNANAFDSLSRYVKEIKGRHDKNNEKFFQWLTHNIRISRELNNFNSENELEEAPVPIKEKEKYMQLLSASDELFRQIDDTLYLPATDRKTKEKKSFFPLKGFKTQTPTLSQLVSVEKLWIELKLMKEELADEKKKPQKEIPVVKKLFHSVFKKKITLHPQHMSEC